MDVNELRQIDVSVVCGMLGLELDKDDQHQYKSDEFRVSITGQKWFDHDAGVGGGGAIDLVMHVKKFPYVAAVSYLSNVTLNTGATRNAKQHHEKTKKPTRPPHPNVDNLPVIKEYLIAKRGLNADLVQWCIDRGLIYADLRANCVFRYGLTGAELRGTGPVQWRAVYGVVDQGFMLPAKQPAGIAVLESAIDAMSYKQLYRHHVAVSLAGNGNHKIIDRIISIALVNNLTIYSAFDGDAGGDIANAILTDAAKINGVRVEQNRPARGSDWNDLLRGG